MHFEKIIEKKLGDTKTRSGDQPIAEVLDMEFALTENDHHYDLMSIKEKLMEVETFYTTYHEELQDEDESKK